MEDDLKKVLHSDASNSEKYNACIKLAETVKETEKSMYYYVRSYHYDSTRVAGIYKLIMHYCCENQNAIAEGYFSMIKTLYENGNANPEDSEIFEFFIPYYMIIVSQRTRNGKISSLVTSTLFKNRNRNISAWYVRNLIYNVQFILEHVNKDLLQSYVTFLVENGYQLETVSSIRRLEEFGIQFKFPARFSEEECKQSKKILFYTGFANPWWNYTYSINHALGGSETAVAYLSKCFPKDWEVYVTGEVHEESFDNVNYVHIRNMQSLFNENAFHTIIVSRYVAFFEMFKFWSYQTFIWAHDTCLLPYGSNLNVNQIIEKWHPKITGVVCLTKWHKELYTEYYPLLQDKIHIINNGIKDDLFNLHIPKVRNRFVYTSCSNRGLKRLLELWSEILENMPDAELKIASYVPFPNNDEDNKMNEYIQKTPSITHLGKLGSRELYELMMSSEFWLYPTCWHETSCITALEMLRCGVICVYYPLAGLTHTIAGNGIAVNRGEEVDAIMKLSEYDKRNLIKKGKEYVQSCSWMHRYTDSWSKLLFKTSPVELPPIKIVNLERRTDRKSEMIRKLEDKQIKNYEFVKAVDGMHIEPTREIFEIFRDNDHNYSAGVVGCALSHVNIWKQLLNDTTTDVYIVLEDDVEFTDAFVPNIERTVNEMKTNSLEYVLLGWNTVQELDKNVVLKRHTQHVNSNEGTFGYIIHKHACKKLLNYFRKNRIQYAIDKQKHYIESGVQLFVTGQPLVTSNCVQQTNMPVDSDIQYHKYHIQFTESFPKDDNILKSYFGRTLKIMFCDWWAEEYGGGKFDIQNNFFVELLKQYSDYKISVVTENPDLVFYSVFGNEHKKYSCRKVFYAGEPYSPREEADYNLTFAEDCEKNTRLPLWLCYLTNEILEECKIRREGNYTVPSERPNFCSFIASNPGPSNIRKTLVDKITNYKQVACGGPYLNNIGFIVDRGLNASGKIEFNKLFKFSAAFENNNKFAGYCTEKILDAFKSNCIPIYWGHRNVVEDFDDRCFINANDFLNLDDLVEYIRLIDMDSERYKGFFEHPILTEKWLHRLLDPEQTFYRNIVSSIVGNVDGSSSE